MQYKQEFPLAVDRLGDDGAFAGYASVFHLTDTQNDIILPGAFDQTIRHKGGSIKLLWQHRPDEPIGVITMLQEDSKGLYVEGKLNLDVQRAREAYSLLKSGAIDGLSIGYSAVQSEISADGARVLKEVDLWEISLVTFPANQAAGVTRIKTGMPETVRDFEHFLRDAGYSRSQAKAISAYGFKSATQNDDDPFVELEGAFDRAIRVLME